MKTFLDDTGRIVIPGLVQAQMGLKPGDALTLEEENGKWFLQPVKAAPEDSAGKQPRGALTPAAINEEDLGWEELDYGPVPLRRIGNVPVRVERQGRLAPMMVDPQHE